MIRKVNKSDLPQMLKIWNANYKVLTSSQKKHSIKSLENWYETRTKINHEYFGMLDGKLEYFGTSKGKTLKAFAILKYTKKGLWIKMLATDKHEKGKGYGKALVRFAIKESKDRPLFCECMVNNWESINFFFKFGFKIIRYNKKLEEFVMQYQK